jgi:centromeric protein E
VAIDLLVVAIDLLIVAFDLLIVAIHLLLVAINAGRERIQVFYRARGGSENTTRHTDHWTLHPDGKCITDGKITFAAEATFGGKVPTSGVYETAVKGIVHSVTEGYNGTIMAYGQTGAGKTFTMRGEGGGQEGIMQMAMADVFRLIEADLERKYVVTVAYLELYNEQLYDLLAEADANSQKKLLKLTADGDADGNFHVECLEEKVATLDAALALLTEHDSKRTIARTDLNAQSSRSHTVVRLSVTSTPRVSESTTELAKVSMLNLVDLAGSESSSRAGTDGKQLVEGSKINKSLLTLGMVMRGLASAQKPQHILPYRDSKLTKLLKPALGRNARTALLCCVQLSEVEESRRTMEFGQVSRM